MKEKLILVLFGLSLGCVAIGIAYPFLKTSAPLPQSAQFESLEQFHQVMLESDDRDVKSDRSVSLRSIITPHPSLEIMYDLRPNLEVKFQGVPLKTNSCGMRGPSYPIERKANTLRIALLGDSFAFGWGVEYEESFAQQLEDGLNKLYGGSPQVEVLNFAVPGYSTFQEVGLFEEKALDFDPDIVLVFFVNNDFALPFFIKDIFGDQKMISGQRYEQKRKQAQLESEKKMTHKLNRLLDANKALRRLNKVTRERGIKLYLTINPHPNWKSDKRKLWILRKNPEIELLPLRRGFIQMVERDNINPKDLSLSNDPHPSPLKHKILGELLTAFVYTHNQAAWS